MSYTVLARRYRSGTFDEVIGQDHIAQTLKRAITSGRIAHAYLFCGTRGTGKTSTARILAKALNCASSDGPTTEPCGKCESCLAIARGDDIDVIEIDAASNTGVDNIREVIENAQYRPARSRFKVYIIDEVHMLSKSAFNALLKTLEEPPGHVKFILATTEPEKVLPTILSRCQRYDFRNIPTREIAAHLKQICAKEKIEADENAVLMVAKAGAGSMRDSLSLLDRLLSVGERNLTPEMVEQLLGLPKAQLLFDLANAIGAGDVKSTLGQTSAILQSGLSVDSFIAALIDHLRNLLILRTCGPDSTLVEVPGVAMDELVAQANRFDPIALTQDITILEELRRNIRQSQAGRALLDATLVRMALADQFASIGELLSRLDGGGGTPRAARPVAVTAPVTAQKKNPEPAPAVNASSSPLPPGEGTKLTPPPAPPSLDDEDDDLPRPGKVWTGPSLAELARAAVKPAAPPREDPSSLANVEPVDRSNLPAVWQAMLNLLAAKSPTVHPLLTPGKLVGIEDGQALIRYAPQHDTFIKMLERNGKKDLVREKLTEVIGKPIGVRFEVDPNFTPDPAPQAAPPAFSRPAPPQRPAPRPAPQPAIEEPPSPPPPPAVKVTPELIETLRNEPLVKALMDNLGATIVKVE
ncbi:MAG TPA: DNA polymerase III subunit gamma/tau [Tepidisphaeraceae bacterium]|jgi:DNA polymerase-3 subunit gamma/tau